MTAGKRQQRTRKIILWSIAAIAMLLPCLSFAQVPADTAKKDLIQILKSQYGEFTQTDSNSVHKLVGDVKLLHGSDTLYCDSAFLYKNKNSVEAFGNVEIVQADGTMAFADYMRYTGYNRTVYMKGGVTLVSAKDQLWSEQLDYNLNTRIGKYYNGGTLQSDLTLLTSRTGTYNVKTRDARFIGNVYVEDPEYKIYSDDLGYNTDTKIALFFARSVVTNDKSVLHTSNGWYDNRNRLAHFIDRSSMQDGAQYIEADTIDYDRNTGFGKARGRVISIDTVQKATLYCGYAEYNEINGKLLAVDWPLMKIINGNDSLFIKADTFFSEPIANLHLHDTLTGEDSLLATLNALRAAAARGVLADSTQLDSIRSAIDSLSNITDTLPADTISPGDSLSTGMLIMDDSVATIPVTDTVIALSPDSISKPFVPDTTIDLSMVQPKDSIMQVTTVDSLPPPADTSQNNGEDEFSRLQPVTAAPPDTTTKPRYFIGYHHVVIYSDSMQGKCDSLSYMQSDSLMRMFYNPVLWSRNGQILGDTIYAKMDSSKIDWMYVPRNGIMISQSGPEKAGMYDQLQGNKLWAYFTNSKIDSVVATPNAASIYYIKDESDAYVGASEAESEKIEIHFDTTATGQRMRRIYYRKNVTQTTTPMQEVTPAALRLSRFSWLEAQRPKTLGEFLRNTTPPHPTELVEDPECAEPLEELKDTTGQAVPPFAELLKKEHENKRRDAAAEEATPAEPLDKKE